MTVSFMGAIHYRYKDKYVKIHDPEEFSFLQMSFGQIGTKYGNVL